jgi:hypothetical protein
MFQFNDKLKVSERVKAKCDRHPRYNPNAGLEEASRVDARLASLSSICVRRAYRSTPLTGSFENSITVDAASSTPRQLRSGRGELLNRRVALAAVWLCIRPRKADGGTRSLRNPFTLK